MNNNPICALKPVWTSFEIEGLGRNVTKDVTGRFHNSFSTLYSSSSSASLLIVCRSGCSPFSFHCTRLRLPVTRERLQIIDKLAKVRGLESTLFDRPSWIDVVDDYRILDCV